MKDDKRKIRPETLESLRQTIIDLFADNQFHEVGMRDICKKAGASPQTVYKYFGDKQELLAACIEQDLAELATMTEVRLRDAETVREAVEALANTQFEFYADRPTIAKIVYLNLPPSYWIARQSKAQMAFQSLLANTLGIVHSSHSLFGQVPVSLLEDIAAGGAARITIRWLIEDQKDDLVQLGKQYTEIMVETILQSHDSDQAKFSYPE